MNDNNNNEIKINIRKNSKSLRAKKTDIAKKSFKRIKQHSILKKSVICNFIKNGKIKASVTLKMIFNLRETTISTHSLSSEQKMRSRTTVTRSAAQK